MSIQFAQVKWLSHRNRAEGPSHTSLGRRPRSRSLAAPRAEGPTQTLRIILAATAIVCATSGVLWAQAPSEAPKTMLVVPPAPLLPATLGGFHRSGEGDAGDGLGKLDEAGLSQIDKNVLSEDGLKRFAQSEFGNSNGKDFWPFAKVTVYKFGDASGAIAAYDYFRKPGMRSQRVGDSALANEQGLLVRSGANLAVLTNLNFKNDAAKILLAQELIEHLPKASGTAALAPLLPTMLPAKGLEADSVRYALGPAGYQAMGGVLPPGIVGFDKSAETVTAKYKGGGVLTLLLYPTPQIAGEHGRAVEAELSHDAAGTVKVRREGPLVLLTTGAWKPADAQAMVDGIHLHSEVSFDKPMPLEFHAEVQKTYSLLASIAIFCGIGALAALVLGLFFGGGRALIRVMQGKPAASEPEFLRIDLRGPAHNELRGDPKA
jgi:hypothetical protein